MVSITLEHINGCLSAFVEVDGQITWHTVYATSRLNGKLLPSGKYVDFASYDKPPTWDVRLQFGRSDDQQRNRNALEQCRGRQHRLDTQLAPDSVTPEMLEDFNAKPTERRPAAEGAEDGAAIVADVDEADDAGEEISDLERLVDDATAQHDAAGEVAADDTTRTLLLERELGSLARTALERGGEAAATYDIRAQIPRAYMDVAAVEARESVSAALEAGTELDESTRRSHFDAALGRLVRLRHEAEQGDEDARRTLFEAEPSVPLPEPPSTRESSTYDFKLRRGVNYRLKPSPFVRELRKLAKQAQSEPARERSAEVIELAPAKITARPRTNL